MQAGGSGLSPFRMLRISGGDIDRLPTVASPIRCRTAALDDTASALPHDAGSPPRIASNHASKWLTRSRAFCDCAD
jgi:hypothetical protein